MLEILKNAGTAATSVITLCTCAALIIRPLRERLLGINAQKEALKCLLRSEITAIYYQHIDTAALRQFEFENVTILYEAYKKLGGNSFVDKIYAKIRDEWRIVQ